MVVTNIRYASDGGKIDKHSNPAKATQRLKLPAAIFVFTGLWNQFSPTNGHNFGSSVYDKTRRGSTVNS